MEGWWSIGQSCGADKQLVGKAFKTYWRLSPGRRDNPSSGPSAIESSRRNPGMIVEAPPRLLASCDLLNGFSQMRR